MFFIFVSFLFALPNKEDVAKFYEDLALFAKTKGIVISVISIKGSEANLENLGKLTEYTAGMVDRVEPLVKADQKNHLDLT